MYDSPESGKVIGRVSDEFDALQQRDGMAQVRSGGVMGWIRFPSLSAKRSEVIDFVSGIIRIFRGDWSGAESLMSRVIESEQAPNEIRTDACLYKGYAQAQQGRSSVEAFAKARQLSPNAKRCIVYAVMGQFAEAQRLREAGVPSEERTYLLRESRRLLEENRFLFEPLDPWVTTVDSVLERMGIPRTAYSHNPPGRR